MIIVSITGPTMNDAFRQMSGSAPYADLFELRLDLIRDPVIAELMALAGRPVVATCRPVWEGGAFTGDERDRLNILEAAALLGAAFVDLELDTPPRELRRFVERSGGARVIASAHRDLSGRKEADAVYRRLRATGATIVKLVFPVRDAAELGLVRHFLSLAAADRQRAVCIALGEAGEASRILYRKLGGWATYAAPETGPAAAPGQVAASVLRRLYRADRLSAKTRVFGVVGHPVAQSKGVFVHNPLLQRAGSNAVYCRFPVVNLRRFMHDVAPMLEGFSITIPHKASIIRYMRSMDPGAEAIGAINTVIRARGGWRGTNTDAAGALDAIEGAGPARGKTLLLLGAGGAARAIAYEARRRGASVLISTRTASKGRALARAFGVGYVSPAVAAASVFDILVNATPVGMVPDVHASPFPGRIRPGTVVFDAVYNPPITRLLRDAERMGATIVPGTEMYLHQAARQSTLYTGVRPSSRLMRRLLSDSFKR